MSAAGSNYGSGNYGSGNYGSGSYASGVAGSAMPKAKSPTRAGPVVGVLPSRASPPRALTPRAAVGWKQHLSPSQPRAVLPSAGSGSSLPSTAPAALVQDIGSGSKPLHGGGGSLTVSSSMPMGSGSVPSRGGGSLTVSSSMHMHGSGGSLTVNSGGSFTTAVAPHLSSWPSPPRGATQPLAVAPGSPKTWAQFTTSPMVPGVGAVDGGPSRYMSPRTARSPARSGVPLTGASAQLWR